jgi:hypothetical protein
LHEAVQITSLQSGPPQPAAHAQRLGATHSPLPEHPFTPEQSERLHESPCQPRSHSHVYGEVHTPLLEQLSAHTGVPHDGPVQPAEQAHWPPGRHTPCGALHSSRQYRWPQSVPPQPESHPHWPWMQTPRPEHSCIASQARAPRFVVYCVWLTRAALELACGARPARRRERVVRHVIRRLRRRPRRREEGVQDTEAVE